MTDRVCNVDAEHKRLPALRKLVPGADNVSGHIGPVHAIGGLTDHIVALPRLNAAQVRVCRGVIDRWHKMFGRNQVRDLRPSQSAHRNSCPDPRPQRLHACRSAFERRLFQNLATVSQHQHALATLHGSFNHGTGNNGLAAAVGNT